MQVVPTFVGVFSYPHMRGVYRPKSDKSEDDERFARITKTKR